MFLASSLMSSTTFKEPLHWFIFPLIDSGFFSLTAFQVISSSCLFFDTRPFSSGAFPSIRSALYLEHDSFTSLRRERVISKLNTSLTWFNSSFNNLTASSISWYIFYLWASRICLLTVNTFFSGYCYHDWGITQLTGANSWTYLREPRSSHIFSIWCQKQFNLL